MKMMMTILAFVLLTGCASLNPHNTIGEDVGEVALRVVACPITFCFSEFAMHQHRRQQAQEERQAQDRADAQRAYWKWYQALSPEKQEREDRRRVAEEQLENQRKMTALQGLFIGNQMMRSMPQIIVPQQPIGSITTSPMPNYHPSSSQVPRRLNCTSMAYGNSINTNCY